MSKSDLKQLFTEQTITGESTNIERLVLRAKYIEAYNKFEILFYTFSIEFVNKKSLKHRRRKHKKIISAYINHLLYQYAHDDKQIVRDNSLAIADLHNGKLVNTLDKLLAGYKNSMLDLLSINDNGARTYIDRLAK